jgi:hypothetical protein
MNHRFAGFNESGEVQNCVYWLATVLRMNENLINGSTVSEISLDEGNTFGDHLALCMAQIIKYNRFVSLGVKQPGDCATDISCTAGNQDPHKKFVLPGTLWVTLSLLQQAGLERPVAFRA